MCGLGHGTSRGCRPKFGAAIGDAAPRNGHTAAQDGDTPSRHSSGYGDTTVTAWDAAKCDATWKRPGDGNTAPRQHSTFDGKSKYTKHAGNDAQRVTLRASAGYSRDTQCRDTSTGCSNAGNIEFKFVKCGFIAIVGWEQRG